MFFGIKNYLIEWTFNKFGIWVDTVDLCIKIGDDFIAAVYVEDDKIRINYEEDWELYVKEGNLQKLIDKAEEQLAKSYSSKKSGSKDKK